MTTVSGDLLSAASLVVTAVTLLYATWYETGQAARGLAKPRFRADREPAIDQLKATLRSRAIPLLIGAGAMTGVFAPTALDVVWEALRHGPGHGYDVLKASFVVVWVLCLTLTFAAASTVLALGRKIREFRQPDAP